MTSVSTCKVKFWTPKIFLFLNQNALFIIFVDVFVISYTAILRCYFDIHGCTWNLKIIFQSTQHFFKPNETELFGKRFTVKPQNKLVKSRKPLYSELGICHYTKDNDVNNKLIRKICPNVYLIFQMIMMNFYALTN